MTQITLTLTTEQAVELQFILDRAKAEATQMRIRDMALTAGIIGAKLHAARVAAKMAEMEAEGAFADLDARMDELESAASELDAKLFAFCTRPVD